ncbi:ISL3 family transposase [Amycolatopsis sp. NPDC059235]|uniref:ISL3 family transposase n=2 Tax=unclassified Amycolatopsis TaxID=2618356 RepID=UPI00366A6F69
MEQVVRRGRRVELHASVLQPDAVCSGCGVRSGRVHSRYQRCLADPAVGGQETVIRLLVRRFFCSNSDCAKRTFAEQVPGLTVAHARRSPLLRRMLEKIALALGGRPGHRLSRQLAAEVSRSTLLRLIRALPVPEPGNPSVLGVDDFAFRRGHTYGTIVIDMDTHRPVDVLADRLGDTFADWLRAHPGAEAICRDRAGGYAEGARLGAPDAIQIADRFHLLYNLAEAVNKIVRAHRECLHDQPAADAVAQPEPAAPVDEGRRAELTRQRHAEVHALWDKGVGNTAISKALNLDEKTVRRYARAETPDELLTQVPRRGRDLDAHTGFLVQRWQEGCTNAARLTEELRDRGYRGSERTVRRLLQTWRGSATPPAAVATTTPKPRHVTGWIIRPAADRTDQEKADLARILERCPVLRVVHELVGEFGGMPRHRRGQHLDAWIAKARTSDITQLQGFAAGLSNDYDAVRNGLTLALSSGARRRRRLQNQSPQTTNVRPRQLRPPPTPDPPRKLNPRHKL